MDSRPQCALCESIEESIHGMVHENDNDMIILMVVILMI